MTGAYKTNLTFLTRHIRPPAATVGWEMELQCSKCDSAKKPSQLLSLLLSLLPPH